jgi:ABC-2 type transport system permease protein
MWARTLSIMRKEVLHIVRDPHTLVLVFLIPIVQLTLLGYAATTDIDNVRTAVLDGDRSAESRELMAAFEATGYFLLTQHVNDEDSMAALLDGGEARAALVIPAGYGQRISAGEGVEVGFIIDGSDPTVANSVLAAALQVGQAQDRARAGGALPAGRTEVRPTVWYNPGLKSVNYMIPALMGLILQFLSTLVTSMAIVREREQGTIEQLIVTPIRPVELVLGKTVPYVVLSFLNFIQVLLIGVLWFKVPVHGDLGVLLLLSGLFLLGALGMGILISTVSNTQQEAMLLSFLILMPSIFLSGFFFPLEAMPVVLRALSYLIPLRYMLIVVRSVVLKGVGIGLLCEEVVALLIFSAVILGLAARRFRKRLE